MKNGENRARVMWLKEGGRGGKRRERLPQTPIFHASRMRKTPSRGPIFCSACMGTLAMQATILLVVSFTIFYLQLAFIGMLG